MITDKMKTACWMALLLALALWGLTGCRTVRQETTVPMREVAHDTLYRDVIKTDSIYRHDSILIDRGGDTITITRWRDVYHWKMIYVDSIVIQRDTVPVEVRTTQTVTEYRCPWYAKILSIFGAISIVSIAGMAWLKWRS